MKPHRRHMAEQIRVHPMSRMALAGSGYAVQRLDAHAGITVCTRLRPIL